MHQKRTVSFQKDVSVINISYKTTSENRAKSVDYPGSISPIASSFKTRSSTVYLDELRRIEEDKQQRLNLLNNRLANYLEQIKLLGDRNVHLRQQIDEIYRRYTRSVENNEQIGNKEYNLLETEFNNLRRQLNNESKKLLSYEMCFQRADYDKKYYKNELRLFSTTDQTHTLKQQLDANFYELDLLKEQYEKEKQNLQFYKTQYNEYITKLNNYINAYINIIFERIQSETHVYTLKEQIGFEHEYNHRCKQDFEDLEKIQYDSNKQFNKQELDNVIQKIRQDYKKYNEIQISQFELLYKTKFQSFQYDFSHKKKDDHHSQEIKQLTEENQLLQQKLKQLANDFANITKQNQEQYEFLGTEYHQLEEQLPELESFIQTSRMTTVHLTSEINIYRCLLSNLTKKPKPKRSEFTVHFGNGIIWVRI